jgi:hypothetical protein
MGVEVGKRGGRGVKMCVPVVRVYACVDYTVLH